MASEVPLMSTPLALAAVAALSWSPPLSAPDHDPYPPVRHATVLRFLHLKGDVELGELNGSVRELDAEVVYGPRAADSRPGNHFVAIECPADLAVKDLARALRKAKVKAEETEWFAFSGRNDSDSQFPSFGKGFTSKDFVLGMSGDIRWYDSEEGFSQFYCTPRKLDAEDILERYQKLTGPFHGGNLGGEIHESFTWRLPSVPEPKVAKKLLKTIAKLDGITDVGLEGDALTVEVTLSGLVESAPPIPYWHLPPGGETSRDSPPRARFFTNELFDVLSDAELTPVAAAGDGD